MSESLDVLLCLGAVVLFERRRDAAAGACLGYAFLVRPETVVLLLGLGVVRVWRDRRIP